MSAKPPPRGVSLARRVQSEDQSEPEAGRQESVVVPPSTPRPATLLAQPACSHAGLLLRRQPGRPQQYRLRRRQPVCHRQQRKVRFVRRRPGTGICSRCERPGCPQGQLDLIQGTGSRFCLWIGAGAGVAILICASRVPAWTGSVGEPRAGKRENSQRCMTIR